MEKYIIAHFIFTDMIENQEKEIFKILNDEYQSRPEKTNLENYSGFMVKVDWFKLTATGELPSIKKTKELIKVKSNKDCRVIVTNLDNLILSEI